MEPEQIFKKLVKDVRRSWGPAWPRLGVTLQQACIRAEICAEIARIPTAGTDPAIYHEKVDALAMMAMAWWPEEGGLPLAHHYPQSEHILPSAPITSD